MTLREKILKTFVVTIREVNTHGGPEAFFQKYPVGGFYFSEAKPLLDENGLEVGTATTLEKLQECRRASKNRLWVCADGVSKRGQTIHAGGQKSLGGSRNLQDAYNFGKSIGMQMNDKGIDMVLAPSIDMCLDHLMYLTAISDDPAVTAEIYRQVVRGIQDQGVCSTVKHFPGLGTSFVNMHIGPGANTLPFDEWMRTYGYTYQQMFAENAMAVMTTHVSLTSFDPEGDHGYYPIATYSPRLTTELLKNRLGFQGAVITDALIMGGMATGNLVEETVQAFRAGADLLLWPPVEAAERIEEMLLSGEIPMSRLEDALARIERMENFRRQALENHAYDTPDSRFVDRASYDIARHGMCLLRNEIGLLPLQKDRQQKILIIDATETNGEISVMSRRLQQELTARGFAADVERDIYDVPSRVCWQADIDRLQARYDLVIFHLNAPFVAEWSVPHMLIWASHMFDKKKKIIVNYGSPYYAVDYFPEDPTFIEMNCGASAEAIAMLADGLLGEMEFTGKPVLSRIPCAAR